MKNLFLITFALLIFFIYSANAQTDKISVNISVTADNSIKSDIESYIKRELRALNDIDLYATKPDFEIQLIAISPGNAVAISVIVLQKFDFTEYLSVTLSSKGVDAKTKESLVNTFAVHSSVKQHFLYSDSSYNLSELCKTIVASIDAKTFERQRKLDSYINGLINSKNNSSTTQPKQNDEPVFERRYVGGNKPPQIIVKNNADKTLTLNFGGSKFVIPVGQSQTIDTTDGGNFNFTASAPGIKSLSGQKNFERGYVYTWTFYVVTRPR